LCGQFAGDRGKKKPKEVGEERKRKRSFTCRERRKLRNVSKMRRSKQQQEVIKARAVVTGPVQVGKIDLNPKTCSCSSSCGRGRRKAQSCGFGS
jgi:translation initiation factor IF-2